MKVKIGIKIIDAENEPILLIFKDAKERKLVGNHLINSHENVTKYCMFPDNMDKDVIKIFMKIE